jgi:hypothetical protein
MSASMLDERFLGAIRVTDVTSYLGEKGWRRRNEYPRPALLVFDGPEDDAGEPIVVTIPASDRFQDFRPRLRELIRLLSQLEGRPPAEIAGDLVAPNADRLDVRVVADFAATGSVPMGYAAQLVSALRDLLAAAACAEEEPRPFFPKVTRIGTEHADRCRFGQTQPGSFIARIECPALAAGEPEIAARVPFARRVTTRIMRGLGMLHTAVLDGRITQLTSSYAQGLNANMCEALLHLRPRLAEPEFEFSVNWARALPPVDGLPRVVCIERRGFDSLSAAARSLRSSVESAERELHGHIVRLELEGTVGGRILLRFETEGRRQHARVHLGAAEYRLACDAHRDGRGVRVWGRLEREGKQWRLMSPRDFQVGPPGRA